MKKLFSALLLLMFVFTLFSAADAVVKKSAIGGSAYGRKKVTKKKYD